MSEPTFLRQNAPKLKPDPRPVPLKQVWLAIGVIAAIFAAGAVARAKVFKLLTGTDAEAIETRMSTDEGDVRVLNDKYDHLHEEIRDARQDFRDYLAHGYLLPLPTETPFPKEGPTP